jgi:hypothetical protein
MTSTDIYLVDDSTSKARALCLLKNTLASEGRPAGETDGGRHKPMGKSNDAGGGQCEGTLARIPHHSRPTMAARPCAGLEWIRHM